MRDPICVLKFGSSVLNDADDIPKVVLEIYREVRRGRKVVAVVSAQGNTTDQLLKEARDNWGEPEPESLARLLETGEAQAAARLGLALDAAGVPARVLDPAQIGLRTSCEILDAEPLAFNADVFDHLFHTCPVAVVPGFSGRTVDGICTLLGRGGSDLTALFLARGLDAVECRLLKDVDGLLRVRDDGQLDFGTRYATASYEECLRVGGPLIQPKAVEFAAANSLAFRIARCGSGHGTLAGPVESRFESVTAVATTRVALAGLGSVGLGVFRWLRRLGQEFEVVGVLVTSLDKARPRDIPNSLLTTSPEHFLKTDPDLLIEVMGGDGTADFLVAQCEQCGIPVVSANKLLLAQPKHLPKQLNPGHPGTVRCSASVGGSVPALEAVTQLALKEEIVELKGIINGTCNFILDRIHLGRGHNEALAEAQLAGMAEADPTLDISGLDCVYKLSLLATTGFGQLLPPEAISCQGLEEVTLEQVKKAQAQGGVLKLVATAWLDSGKILGSVGLEVLPADHPLASCSREKNGLQIKTRRGQRHLVTGKGAGRWPTTVSVLADALDINRTRLRKNPGEYPQRRRRSA